MQADTIDIKLSDFSPAGVRVLSSRHWGISARNRSNINKIAMEHKMIVITIPEHVASITPSFLEEFLEGVLINMGWDQFRKRVVFKNEGHGHYKIDSDLAETAARVYNDQTLVAY